jgi:2-aminoadipate transaminase
MDTGALLEAAVDEKVAFVPGVCFHPDGSGCNTMRLNFSNASEIMIEEGIDRLAGVILPRLAGGAPTPAAAVHV